LSRDSIERNINGSNKDQSEMQQVQFECYGPQGVQIIVCGLTDNNNRTIANLNGYLSKLHGQLAKSNSVKVFFDNLGYILVIKNNNITVDNIMEWTLDYQIVDIKEFDDVFEIKSVPSDFYKIKDVLLAHHCEIYESEIKLIAQNVIKNLTDENKQRLEKFIDSCNEDDDMQ
jgi:YebC/PmpR family DNA-binding regulatory protein